DFAGAAACQRKTIAFVPRFAPAHFGLGLALYAGGDVAGAIASYRRAIALDPRLDRAHFGLGQALLKQGQFAEAEAATRRCLDLASPTHPLHQHAQPQLQQCQRLHELDSRLDAVRAGKAKPADTAECLALARLAQQPSQAFYAASARLYA